MSLKYYRKGYNVTITHNHHQAPPLALPIISCVFNKLLLLYLMQKYAAGLK